MKNVKLKVLTVIVGSMLASNYAMADNTELLSKPKDRTVFSGKAPVINLKNALSRNCERAFFMPASYA